MEERDRQLDWFQADLSRARRNVLAAVRRIPGEHHLWNELADIHSRLKEIEEIVGPEDMEV